MSQNDNLKAKFEAVIYAAEEPVTLAQLATLFADELAPAEADQAEPPASQDSSEAAAQSDAPADVAPADVAPAEVVPAAATKSDAAKSDAAKSDAAKSDAAAARAEQRKLRDAAKVIVDELLADYAAEGENARGMEIREVAGGYRMATKPEYHDAVRGFIKSLKPPLKLSLPALETLAVIAYKQPVTAPEIGEIRGVDSGGVLGGLLARKLITTAGRKQVLGRPILYKTTQEFLLRFGLKDVAELPSLEEFEKMAAEVAEFDDAPASAQQAAAEQAALAEAESAELEVEADKPLEHVADAPSEMGPVATAGEDDQAQP